MVETIEGNIQPGAISLAVNRQKPQNPLHVQRTHDEDIYFYLRFPYLFYECYHQVPAESYDQLALSQYLYLNHVLMTDRLMDGKLLLEPQIAYWVNAVHQKIVLILSQLFAPEAPFWAYFDQCRCENTQALLLERVKHTYKLQPYSESEKILIFGGKSAMAKAGVAALACLSGQDVPENLLISCEAFHIGLQLMDNLQDWRSDYRDHLYTPLLTEVLLENGLTDEAEATERVDVNRIGTLIYNHGYAHAALDEAVTYFQLALHMAQGMLCPAWQTEILRTIQGCNEYAATLAQKIQQLQAKRTPPAQKTPGAAPGEADWATTMEVQVASAPGSPADKETLLLAAQETLQRCAGLVPVPGALFITLDTAQPAGCGAAAREGERWHIGLFPGKADRDGRPALQIFKEHLACQIGRAARLAHCEAPQSLLDELCIDGLGLVLMKQALPEVEDFDLLPSSWRWFEHNKHYLWQEIQPFLGSPAGEESFTAFQFENLRPCLSYDLINSYCTRMGGAALARAVQAASADILNKSTVLAIANRIAGQTAVRFDL